MGDEWRESTVGNEVDILLGFAFRSSAFATEPPGHRLVRGDNIKRGSIEWGDKSRYWRELTADLEKYALRPGDVVVGMDGSRVGENFARISEEDVPALLVQRVACLRAKDDVDQAYLRYLICNPNFTGYIKAVHTGTSIPHISGTQIGAYPILVPALTEQHAIAHILGTLDAKIELNLRTSETLETMAQALFTSWFAELDLVRVKAAELVREGILEIGDGYRAKNSEIGEPGLPFIRAGDLSNGFDTDGAEVLCEASVRKAGRKVARLGDVAFTSKGTVGRFARVTTHCRPFVYSPQVCYWRSLDERRLHPAILYFWMQSEDLMAQIDAVAGQTDMAPYVSLRDQRMMDVPLFPESQQDTARVLDSLLDRQALAADENRALTNLRDTLLPKLVSGALRLRVTECATNWADAV